MFSFFRKPKRVLDERLFGKWRLITTTAIDTAEDTVSEFTPDGRLIYSITEGGNTGIMNLIYRTENGYILSNQPSHPREDRTKYDFTEDGALILDYGGERTTFSRIQK
ncbi:MAG: hypothetical protein JNN17_18590 [Verrucomicrobiaceae bacterium]|nr:hypothetical protein [Verrucomicrobiaceae bacterium]